MSDYSLGGGAPCLMRIVIGGFDSIFLFRVRANHEGCGKSLIYKAEAICSGAVYRMWTALLGQKNSPKFQRVKTL